jgi:hypothetical protein
VRRDGRVGEVDAHRAQRLLQLGGHVGVEPRDPAAGRERVTPRRLVRLVVRADAVPVDRDALGPLAVDPDRDPAAQADGVPGLDHPLVLDLVGRHAVDVHLQRHREVERGPAAVERAHLDDRRPPGDPVPQHLLVRERIEHRPILSASVRARNSG